MLDIDDLVEIMFYDNFIMFIFSSYKIIGKQIFNCLQILQMITFDHECFLYEFSKFAFLRCICHKIVIIMIRNISWHLVSKNICAIVLGRFVIIPEYLSKSRVRYLVGYRKIQVMLYPFDVSAFCLVWHV